MTSAPWPMRGPAGLLPPGSGPAGAAWSAVSPTSTPVGATPGEVTAAVDSAVRTVFDVTGRRWTGCIAAAARAYLPACTHSYGRCRCVAAARSIGLAEAFAYPVRAVDHFYYVPAGGSAPVDAPSTLWRWDPWPTERLWLSTGPTATAAGQLPTLLCQDPAAPLGEPCTWWVEASIGEDPPPLAITAAADLAAELLKAVHSPDDCNLPDGVRSIVRRGITIEFGAPGVDTFGVPSLDTLIGSYPHSVGPYARATNRLWEWAAVDSPNAPLTGSC